MVLLHKKKQKTEPLAIPIINPLIVDTTYWAKKTIKIQNNDKYSTKRIEHAKTGIFLNMDD